MARALDVADVPALLEAMVGWLDPADDVGERAILRRWQPQGAPVDAVRAWLARLDRRGRVDALRRHWPEYLMEAAGLGLFMISAGLFGTLLFYPGSPVAQALPDPLAAARADGPDHGPDRDRHHLLALGPAVGRAHQPGGDADLLAARQGQDLGRDLLRDRPVRGGALGVLLVLALLGAAFADPPVQYVATVPGPDGTLVALLAEAAISFGLMLTILFATNTPRLMRLTGVFAGCLVALYITLEAPLSGMSMNPARTVASALPGNLWQGWWLYFVGPIAGMLLAVEAYRPAAPHAQVLCAKLHHHNHRRCIFRCGHAARAGARPTERETIRCRPNATT